MRTVVKYKQYEKAVKEVERLGFAVQLNDKIDMLVKSDVLHAHDHPLHRTSRHKSGISGLRELHVTGEILLIYRRIGQTVELVDICKNHKELRKKY